MKATIGHRGEEGWSSSLADNCFLSSMEEVLRYVPLSLRAKGIERRAVPAHKSMRIAAERGKVPSGDARPSDSADPPLARATITHCPALAELGVNECPDCTIGIPESHFAQLVDGMNTWKASALRTFMASPARYRPVSNMAF